MASYTMQLREIFEHYSQDELTLNTTQIIEKGREKLFDFPYPMFDEAYRNVFETNFIKNFYMREIGFETEGLFKFRLDTWLNINMPYFNKLYESELLKFNPLESYNLKTTYQKKSDTLQNDDKTHSQSGSNDGVLNESESSIQNGTNDVTQNGTNFKTQNDDKTRSQNTDNTTTEKTQSDEKGSSEITAENETNTEINTTNKQNTKTDDTTDHFNRTLKSETPDSRLSITPNADGTGVIQYANEIQENKDTDKKKTTGEITDTGKDTNDVLSTTSTTTESETNLDVEKNIDSKTTDSENEILSSSVNDTFNNSTNDRSTNQINNQRNGTTSEKTSVNATDKVTSKINDIEDYIEEKVGSIGVKTYSEMIIEYRSSLIRIEQTIFNEMNELFMLVY